ncbi:hypothetical protein ACSSS7_004344 [Eimeria intestinalis]
MASSFRSEEYLLLPLSPVYNKSQAKFIDPGEKNMHECNGPNHQHPQQRGVTTSSGLAALVASLMVVYLIITCARTLSSAGVTGVRLRYLASGSRDGEEDACLPWLSQEEEEGVHSGVSEGGMAAAAAAAAAAEGGTAAAAAAAAAIPPSPAGAAAAAAAAAPLVPLSDDGSTRYLPPLLEERIEATLRLLKEPIFFLQRLIRINAPKANLAICRTLCRLVALELSAFALVPARLQALRTSVAEAYADLLQQVLTTGHTQKKAKDLGWDTYLLTLQSLLRKLGETPVPTERLLPLKYLSMMYTQQQASHWQYSAIIKILRQMTQVKENDPFEGAQNDIYILHQGLHELYRVRQSQILSRLSWSYWLNHQQIQNFPWFLFSKKCKDEARKVRTGELPVLIAALTDGLRKHGIDPPSHLAPLYGPSEEAVQQELRQQWQQAMPPRLQRKRLEGEIGDPMQQEHELLRQQQEWQGQQQVERWQQQQQQQEQEEQQEAAKWLDEPSVRERRHSGSSEHWFLIQLQEELEKEVYETVGPEWWQQQQQQQEEGLQGWEQHEAHETQQADLRQQQWLQQQQWQQQQWLQQEEAEEELQHWQQKSEAHGKHGSDWWQQQEHQQQQPQQQEMWQQQQEVWQQQRGGYETEGPDWWQQQQEDEGERQRQWRQQQQEESQQGHQQQGWQQQQQVEERPYARPVGRPRLSAFVRLGQPQQQQQHAEQQEQQQEALGAGVLSFRQQQQQQQQQQQASSEVSLRHWKPSAFAIHLYKLQWEEHLQRQQQLQQQQQETAEREAADDWQQEQQREQALAFTAWSPEDSPGSSAIQLQQPQQHQQQHQQQQQLQQLLLRQQLQQQLQQHHQQQQLQQQLQQQFQQQQLQQQQLQQQLQQLQLQQHLQQLQLQQHMQQLQLQQHMQQHLQQQQQQEEEEEGFRGIQGQEGNMQHPGRYELSPHAPVFYPSRQLGREAFRGAPPYGHPPQPEASPQPHPASCDPPPPSGAPATIAATADGAAGSVVPAAAAADPSSADAAAAAASAASVAAATGDQGARVPPGSAGQKH